MLKQLKTKDTLRAGVSSDSQITSWIDHLGKNLKVPTRRISDDYWQIDMSNQQAEFTVDLRDQDPWITLGTELMPDVKGKDRDRAEFLGVVLDVNAKINGAKIGREEDRLIVTHEEPKEGMDQATLYRSIAILNNAVEQAVTQLYPEIPKHNLKFVQK